MAVVVAVAGLDVVAGVRVREKERKGRTSDVQARVLVVRLLSAVEGPFTFHPTHAFTYSSPEPRIYPSSELPITLNHDKKRL